MKNKARVSLFKYSDDRPWYLEVYVYGHGIRRRFPLDTNDREEAEAMLEQFRRFELDRVADALIAEKEQAGEDRDWSETRLDRMADWYLEQYMPSRDRDPKTIKNREPILRRLLAYCRTRRVGTLHQLSTRIIDDWQAHEKLLDASRPARRRDELVAVKHFVETSCLHHDFDAPRIVWDIPPKRRGGGEKAVPIAVLHSYLQKAKEMYARDAYDLAAWIALTSMRPSDIEVFRWEHDLGDRIRFARKKGRRDRDPVIMEVPVNAAMREILERRKAMHGEDGPVFRRVGNGRPYTSNGVTKVFEDFGKRCGIAGVPPTGIRKTFATHCAQVANSPKTMQSLMAHSDVRISLDHYADASFDAMVVASNELARVMLPVPGLSRES